MGSLENRVFEHDVMEIVQTRWSSRAFDRERKLSEEDLGAVLEAATYAPNCFNEQPWRWVVARQGSPAFEAIVSTMTPGNQAWAPEASVLLVMLSKQTFSYNNQPNRFARFDTGTAWGYLTLEAQSRGVLAHGMGGFKPDELRNKLGIPADFEIVALAALGYYGSPDYLPDSVKTKEKPNPRKPVVEVIFTPEI